MKQTSTLLREKVAELNKLKKVKNQIALLNTRLAEEEKDLAVMEIAVRKERMEMEILEKKGILFFFKTFLGNPEERIEKEREDHVRASLRYNALIHSIELIRFELSVLQRQVTDEKMLNKEVRSLTRKRGEEILKFSKGQSTIFLDVDKKLEEAQKKRLQFKEAMNTGKEILAHLTLVEEDLEHAQKWLREYMYCANKKPFQSRHHGTLTQAKQSAYKASHVLVRFVKEVKDVYSMQGIHLEIPTDEFHRMTIMFYDNLISDWVLSEKLRLTLRGIMETRVHVERLMIRLTTDHGLTKEEVLALEEKWNTLVVEGA